MPHKRNPVLSENLTGLARVVRAAVVPALENVALWHERDISHSSVERVIAPDATIALDFALVRLAGMMQRLVVYPERMAANLESLGGVVHSGDVLLALTRAGISREDAYAIVQRNAMATWERLGTPEGRSFRDNLLADPEVARPCRRRSWMRRWMPRCTWRGGPDLRARVRVVQVHRDWNVRYGAQSSWPAKAATAGHPRFS